MGASSTVALGEVWKLLGACASGFTKKENQEYFRISYGGKMFGHLPRGPHGRRNDNTKIQVGHVRQLCRHLGIEECARREMPELWG